MKLLANENVPRASINVLYEAGCDIVSVSLLSPGIDDATVLRTAREQDRVVVTFDRDYGELVYRRGLPSPPAVIYLRFVPRSPEEPASVLQRLFQQGIKILGYFLVVDRDSFRRRRLPG